MYYLITLPGTKMHTEYVDSNTHSAIKPSCVAFLI